MSENRSESVVVLLSGDLGMLAQVQTGAEQTGQRTIWANRLDTALEKITETQTPSTVVVDLTLRDIDLDAVAKQARERFATIRLVAFGPHVDEEKLAAAEAAGFDEVLARGQFLRNVSKYVTA